MTLRARLTGAFLAVVVVPLLVGTALLSVALPAAFSERQAREVASAARLAAAVVAQRCQQAQVVAEAVGRAAAVPDPASRQSAVASFVERGLAEGVRVELDGAPVVTAGRVPIGAPSCAAGQVSAAGTGQLAASVRLQSPTGSPLGTAVAALGAGQPLATLLRDAVGRGEVALLAGDRVLASSAPIPPELVRRAVAARGVAVHADDVVAAAVEPGPGQPVGVLVVQRESGGVVFCPRRWPSSPVRCCSRPRSRCCWPARRHGPSRSSVTPRPASPAVSCRRRSTCAQVTRWAGSPGRSTP